MRMCARDGRASASELCSRDGHVSPCVSVVWDMLYRRPCLHACERRREFVTAIFLVPMELVRHQPAQGKCRQTNSVSGEEGTQTPHLFELFALIVCVFLLALLAPVAKPLAFLHLFLYVLFPAQMRWSPSTRHSCEPLQWANPSCKSSQRAGPETTTFAKGPSLHARISQRAEPEKTVPQIGKAKE